MSYGLYISAEGAHAQSARLEMIANNLANVDTVGFKRQLAIFQARYAEAEQQGQVSARSGATDDVGGGVSVLASDTDFTPGPVHRTGVSTDMALRGEGFFLVRRGTEKFLTRAGDFRINDRGELVTQQGDAVMSDNNSPVVINRPTDPITVTLDGEIQQGSDRQRLAIVRPASRASVVRAGENLFRPLSEPVPVQAADRNVVGGYLEGSGVSPTSEMVEMIEASRMLEANLNMMQTQDQMFGNLISRLMRVS